MDPPDYLKTTGPVSCDYWKASLAFILLPQALCALAGIVISMKDRLGCGDALLGVFTSLLYPLYVPAMSIYYSGKLLLGGEDEGDNLTNMKVLKMFEHLGEAGPQLILQIIFITNNGGVTLHP